VISIRHRSYGARGPCMLLLCAGLLLSSRLMATELEPYEFVAAPPGTTALIGYLSYVDHESYQPVDGPSITRATHLDDFLGIARAAQYFDVGTVEVLVDSCNPSACSPTPRLGVSISTTAAVPATPRWPALSGSSMKRQQDAIWD